MAGKMLAKCSESPIQLSFCVFIQTYIKGLPDALIEITKHMQNSQRHKCVHNSLQYKKRDDRGLCMVQRGPRDGYRKLGRADAELSLKV